MHDDHGKNSKEGGKKSKEGGKKSGKHQRQMENVLIFLMERVVPFTTTDDSEIELRSLLLQT